jgi:hypothetical protein
MRRLTLAVCCLVALAAPAAPVPKGKAGFEAPEWKKDDPLKDCTFSFDARAGSVTIKAPGRKNYRSLAAKVGTASGLSRVAAKGDFDAQVRVRAFSTPDLSTSASGLREGRSPAPCTLPPAAATRCSRRPSARTRKGGGLSPPPAS